MQFCLDREHEGEIWVDRGRDDRADHFKPCTPCFEELQSKDLEDRVWDDLDLCPKCQMSLLGEFLQNDFFGNPRPIIQDSDHNPRKAFDDINWNLPEPFWKLYVAPEPEEPQLPLNTEYLGL